MLLQHVMKNKKVREMNWKHFGAMLNSKTVFSKDNALL